MMCKLHEKKGFVALTTVLVLGAILLAICISIAFRSISGAEIAVGYQAKLQSETLANLCAERALIELQRTLFYNGGETIETDEGSCDILEVTGEGAANRVIHTISTVSGYTSSVEIQVARVSPETIITSWEFETEL